MRFRPFKWLYRLAFPKPAKVTSRALRGKPNFGQFMQNHRIAHVIDVGANTGQFAQFLRNEIQYGGNIISIEPLPDAFAALEDKAVPDPHWSVLNLALGTEEGILPFNIAGNSQSSSFLPMLDRHADAAPSSRYRAKVDVRVARLDRVPELRAAALDRCLLKIDTQGYEDKVLAGAVDILSNLSLIYLEASLVPLYEGGPLIEEIIGYLRGKGFAPIAIYRGFSDRATGDQLQADVMFANTRG